MELPAFAASSVVAVLAASGLSLLRTEPAAAAGSNFYQTTDTSKVAYFGGMYTCDAIAGAAAPGWAQASAYCKQHGLIWAPSAGPGFINTVRSELQVYAS
jgi:hypothetical protein